MTKRKTTTVVNECETERERLETEFLRFSTERGWDEGRQILVLAELMYDDPLDGLLDECVEVGLSDGLIEQLHRYYGEEEDDADADGTENEIESEAA